MSDGFLGRWSRRKLDAKSATPLPDEGRTELPAATETAIAAVVPAVPAAVASGEAAPARAGASPAAPEPVAVPPPTLEDVQSLTAESDFSRFTARDVAPEVKNAALRKLFADPRYNVMDGMDVYVGDYSKPDPLPGHMLRQLAVAATLKLFEDEPSAPAAAPGQAVPGPRDVADNPEAQTVAQSAIECAAVPEPTEDDHPDLRLQQDDAVAAVQPPGGAA